MPELPEVETIRRILEKNLIGKRIKDIEVRKPKVFQGEEKEAVGRTIEAVKRRGKVLVIQLSRGKSLLVHFKLTGQLIWVPKGGGKIKLGHPIPFIGDELPAKTTHIILKIDGGQLFYNDLRRFGWMKVVDDKEMEKIIGKLGPEPFDKEFNNEYLKKIFSRTKKPIKLVLMNQEKISGVGNIYANDALFEAKISPLRPANQLNNKEIENLKKAIVKVLNNGLKYGGSSAKDEAYIKPTGEPGKYQKHFLVYQKNGERCPRCGSIIKRVNLGGRGTFFCLRCQR